jgi:signal transduction histidine kinase
VVAARLGHQSMAAERHVVAVAVGIAPFHDALSSVLKKTPLLPPTLAGFSNDMLGVRVAARDGAALVATAAFPDGPVARGSLDATVGGVPFEVAVPASAADRLVIGGTAPSRLPWLLGLLALTAVLLAIAAVQLRREHELARTRTDFVSSVTHELRTPLAQIRLFAETMLFDRVRSPEEARRSLEIINQEAQRLGHLVDNVLYFSRGEHQSHRIARTPLHLPSAAEALIESFAPLAQSGGRARLELDVRQDVVAPVDPGAFRQVLLNLLDNAVKYGPADQTVRVSIDRRGATAVVAVEDEGPGIDPADRERIWEPYARLTPASASGVAGAGIGLSVVRDLVELHGGRVRVDGAARGARFEVALPA